MINFKQLTENESIDNAYTNKVVVYLESEEDLQIIKERWFFDEGNKIEFKSIDSGEGGGCTQVINRVETERNKGITAFGIVDRDTLMREEKWELWWEIDDHKFKQAKPFGDYILVLRRWELENYLLSPEELEMVLSDKEFRSSQQLDIFIQNLLNESKNLKVLSAAIILSNENGYRFPKSFGFKKGKKVTGEKLQNNVETHLSNNIQSNQVNQQFTRYIQKIEAFAEGNTEPTQQRWERLNRLLDGKLTLQRLDLFNQRGHLATHIRINHKIDPELTTYVKEIKSI